MPSRVWFSPSPIAFQSSLSPAIRRTSRLSLLLLGIHGVVVAIEDSLFRTLFSLDRWFDQTSHSQVAALVDQEILTSAAGVLFTAKLSQIIGIPHLEKAVIGIGFSLELILLVFLWKFAWRDPMSWSWSSSCILEKTNRLGAGTLELFSVTAAVSFLTLNAFLFLATFCTSLFFRALDGFGARLSWSTPLASVAGLALGAFVVGHVAPALFRSSLQFARNRISNCLPIQQIRLNGESPRQRWKERFSYHFPSFQGRVIALMVVPLSIVALGNNLVWAFAVVGGSA